MSTTHKWDSDHRKNTSHPQFVPASPRAHVAFCALDAIRRIEAWLRRVSGRYYRFARERKSPRSAASARTLPPASSSLLLAGRQPS